MWNIKSGMTFVGLFVLLSNVYLEAHLMHFFAQNLIGAYVLKAFDISSLNPHSCITEC